MDDLRDAAAPGRLRQEEAANLQCQGCHDMKAFLAGCAAAIVIAVAAYFTLNSLGMTSANVYSSSNVRL
jgi:hypothetical protein